MRIDPQADGPRGNVDCRHSDGVAWSSRRIIVLAMLSTKCPGRENC